MEDDLMSNGSTASSSPAAAPPPIAGGAAAGLLDADLLDDGGGSISILTMAATTGATTGTSSRSPFNNTGNNSNNLMLFQQPRGPELPLPSQPPPQPRITGASGSIAAPAVPPASSLRPQSRLLDPVTTTASTTAMAQPYASMAGSPERDDLSAGGAPVVVGVSSLSIGSSSSNNNNNNNHQHHHHHHHQSFLRQQAVAHPPVAFAASVPSAPPQQQPQQRRASAAATALIRSNSMNQNQNHGAGGLSATSSYASHGNRESSAPALAFPNNNNSNMGNVNHHHARNPYPSARYHDDTNSTIDGYGTSNGNTDNNNNNGVHSNLSRMDSFGSAAGGYNPERDTLENADTNSISSSFCHTTSTAWAEVEVSQEPGGPPSPRSLHAAALLNGNFLVFGGYDGSQRVNTFHAFNFSEKRWSPVLPSANSGPPPSPRDRHVAVAFGNTFYVHGGFDGERRVSDFWAFDFSTMTWREVVASLGRPPSPRHSHAAVVHGHSMYIFAGYDGSYKSDLHEFDFTVSRWTAIPAAGRRPRARYRATCVVHRDALIVYGGHDGTRHLSDTHIFHLNTQTWSSLATEGTPPIPRDSHISVVHGNSMYVFGGSSGSAMNDLHELQLPSLGSSSSNGTAIAAGAVGIGNGTGTAGTIVGPPAAATATNNNSIGSAGAMVNNNGGNPSNSATTTLPARWRPINAARGDQPRQRFCHVAVVYIDTLYVFGGYDGAERLNDFIRFDFAVYDLTFEVPPSTIINDFRALINDRTLSDVTFVVEEQPVYAHKLMLMRSSYFEALFLGHMREATMDTIRIEEVRYSIFLKVLEYLYTDHIRIPFHDAMELFEAADLFCIPRLKTMCEKRMLESITVANAASIFHAADMHSATALRQKAKKYILSHFEAVSKSSNFEEMGRRNIELVFELLQSR